MTTKRVAFVVALSAALLVGCNKKSSDKDAIRIGVVAPLTGANARFGEMERRSYDLAVEEINKAGALEGKRLVLCYEDDMDKPEVSMTAVERLITHEQVVAVVGPYSSAATFAATTVGEKYKTPFLSPSGAKDEITQRGYRWVFRTNAPTSVYARTIFDFLDEVHKPRSVAMLFEDSGLGVSVAKFAKEEAEARAIPIVYYDRYTSGTPDFKPMLTRIQAAKPDVILFVAYLLDAVLLMRQARELEVEPTLFIGGGGGFTTPEFIESLGGTAEYVLAVSQWSGDAPWPGANDFYRKYTQRYGQPPDFHAAACYAAVYVLADAIKRAGSTDKAALRDALQKTDLETVFGKIRFEDYDGFTNQNRHNMLMLQIQDGAYRTVWPKSVARAKVVCPIPVWGERRPK